MAAKDKALKEHNTYRSILILSAWGYVIVVFPILLLYAGKLLDEFMGTSPYFMLGLFFLALLTGIGRFYKEAWSRHKGV